MASIYSSEMVDPLHPVRNSFVIRAEHFMRYVFAKNYFKKQNFVNKIIYDVASGDGYGEKMLSPIAKEAIGFEISKNFLKYAYQENLTNNDLFILEDLDKVAFEEFIKKNNILLPFGIVCFETFEHVKNPQKLMKSFFDILPSKGILIYSIPNIIYEPKKNDMPTNPFHKHLFTKQDIINLAKNEGFKIRSVLGQPLPNLMLRNINGAVKLIDNYSWNSESKFKFFAKILARPISRMTDYSYSYIVVAQKE
jgi:SAM-dependent methyltransferase